MLGETKLSQVKICIQVSNTFTSLPDDKTVGTRRAFFAMGRNLSGPYVQVPKAGQKPQEVDLVVLIDPVLGMKSTLRVAVGTTIKGVKTQLAKADTTGRTKLEDLQYLMLKLPGGSGPLSEDDVIKGDMTELHCCAPEVSEPAPPP